MSPHSVPIVDDPSAFYWPEVALFPALQRRFAATGELDPVGFYAILDWKAPRARTRHLHRLARIAGSLGKAVAANAAGLHASSNPRECLELLMQHWKFRLPTASAILSVLYPEDFTIYDVRVCGVLGAFERIAEKTWSEELWRDYKSYVGAVRERAPPGTSLRDCDRRIWGSSKRSALLKELDSRAAEDDAAVTTRSPLP